MRPARRFALLVFAGVTLLQAIWIVSVPPFRGIDEFDHVNRAAGVAEGEWLLDEAATDGRGLVTVVPQHIVGAAQAQCSSLEYTGRDNCFSIDSLGNGRVTIATAAGGYHPAYYAVIGLAGRPFEGVMADYAMRTASALLCSLGIALAALCWQWGGTGGWERFGFLTSLTPVLIYSTALPGPNGPEMIAGLIVWCCLLRVIRGGAPVRPLLAVAVAAATVIVTLRFLGPMWLGLIVMTWAVWSGWAAVWSLVLRHRHLVTAAVAVITLGVVGSVAWTMQGTFLGEQEDAFPVDAEVDLGLQPVVWMLQIIAAFPLRREVSHPAVYVVYLLVFVILLAVALRRGTSRERWALTMAVTVTLLLPVIITLLTVRSHGVIWQGRYGLPFSVGIPLMAGAVLTRAGVAPREEHRLMGLGSGLLGLGQAVAVVTVVLKERSQPASQADEAWVDPPTMMVVAVIAAAWVVLFRSTLPRAAQRQVRAPEAATLPAHDVATPESISQESGDRGGRVES